ncbi:hypothetical protein CD178_03078 (plasmid) [Komagataeibacter saccharivorans]|uniref:Uncharacterized protein n=1 Tax=Komagataeibacter saccharivorans TaxID=265959 RepID=A0A347WG29_9PROT|nr:hypothetical protein CD178_03078 [Komagataeibacter saccharivorans]
MKLVEKSFTKNFFLLLIEGWVAADQFTKRIFGFVSGVYEYGDKWNYSIPYIII